jgi:hypothetical protein
MKTLVIDSSLKPIEIENSNNGFPTLVTASLTAWNHHCSLELEPFDFLVPFKMCGTTKGVAHLNLEKNILKTKYVYSFKRVVQQNFNENNKVYSHPLH